MLCEKGTKTVLMSLSHTVFFPIRWIFCSVCFFIGNRIFAIMTSSEVLTKGISVVKGRTEQLDNQGRVRECEGRGWP